MNKEPFCLIMLELLSCLWLWFFCYFNFELELQVLVYYGLQIGYFYFDGLIGLNQGLLLVTRTDVTIE